MYSALLLTCRWVWVLKIQSTTVARSPMVSDTSRLAVNAVCTLTLTADIITNSNAHMTAKRPRIMLRSDDYDTFCIREG